MSTKAKTKKKKSGKKGGSKKTKRGLGFLGAMPSLKEIGEEAKQPAGILSGLFLGKLIDAGLSKFKMLNPEPDPNTGEVSKLKQAIRPGTTFLIGATGMIIGRKQRKGDKRSFVEDIAMGVALYGGGRTAGVLLNKDLFGFNSASPALFGLGAGEATTDKMFLENKEELIKQIQANSFDPSLPALEDNSGMNGLNGESSVFGSSLQLDNALIL